MPSAKKGKGKRADEFAPQFVKNIQKQMKKNKKKYGGVINNANHW